MKKKIEVTSSFSQPFGDTLDLDSETTKTEFSASLRAHNYICNSQKRSNDFISPGGCSMQLIRTMFANSVMVVFQPKGRKFSSTPVGWRLNEIK